MKVFNEHFLKYFTWKRTLNLAWNGIIFGLFLWLIIYLNIHYDAKLQKSAGRVLYIFTLIIEVFFIIVYSLLLVCSQISLEYPIIYWKEIVFLNLANLNFFILCQTLWQAWRDKFLRFRIKEWKTFDIVLIAMAYAAYLIMAFICKQLIPTIPGVFVGFSFEFIAIFFVAFITESFLKTFLTAFICGISLLFFPTVYFINFPQFCFDYLIPNLAISFSTFVVFDHHKKYRIPKFFLFMTIPFFFIYLSRVLGGIFFYATSAYPGFPVALFSLVFNAPNSMFDYLCLIIITPVILNRLISLQTHYQSITKTRN